MTDGPKKGSPEQALLWWREQAPDTEVAIARLLTEIYNFASVGARPIVTRSVQLKDGRTLRLYGRL